MEHASCDGLDTEVICAQHALASSLSDADDPHATDDWLPVATDVRVGACQHEHVYYGRIVLSLYLDRAPWRHAVRIECCVYSSQQGGREHVYADRARRYSAWCSFPMDMLL